MFRSHRRIADSLVARGILTEEQVERILLHCEATGMGFSEAGADLGVLRKERARSPRGSVDFFLLKAEYFPSSTKDYLSPDAILRLGALPLGSKMELRLFRPMRIVNVGLLDPSRRETLREIERLILEKAGRKFSGIRPFLVLPDQFLVVLEKAYGIGITQLFQLGRTVMEPTLWSYLEESQTTASLASA